MTYKVTMAATIPCQQYGNIHPTFDVEGNTHQDAMALGLRLLKDVWDQTATKPLEIRELDNLPRLKGEPLRCWASGTRVFFDEETHTYDSGDGKFWLSGSTFAGRYKSDFPASLIAGKMAAKWDVDAAKILEMWALNAHASSTFGTAVHAALQLRGEFEELSRAVKDGELDACLTKSPVLRPIVESFFEGRENEIARYEAFVADPVLRHCGQIDRLVIGPHGQLTVGDYKTNATLDKAVSIAEPFKKVVPNNQLGSYILQLSFYANILKAHGREVDHLEIYHLESLADGFRWKTHEHEVIDVDGAFK